MKFQQVYAVVDSEAALGRRRMGRIRPAERGATCAGKSRPVHVADVAHRRDETRQLVARLVETVLRTKRPLRVEYRCDLPSMARAYLLTIQPMKEERALMVHDLKDAWHFSPPLNMWHYDPNSRDCKCSFCGNIRFGVSDWTSCDDIGERHPAFVVYEVCSTLPVRRGRCHREGPGGGQSSRA